MGCSDITRRVLDEAITLKAKELYQLMCDRFDGSDELPSREEAVLMIGLEYKYAPERDVTNTMSSLIACDYSANDCNQSQVHNREIVDHWIEYTFQAEQP